MLDRLRSLKDKALETAARRYLNGLAPEVGQVERLALDTGAKTVHATVLLRGAEAPVDLRVGRYQLDRRDERLLVRLHEVTASAPWLDALAGRLLAGREFEIPAEYHTVATAAL